MLACLKGSVTGRGTDSETERDGEGDRKSLHPPVYSPSCSQRQGLNPINARARNSIQMFQCSEGVAGPKYLSHHLLLSRCMGKQLDWKHNIRNLNLHFNGECWRYKRRLSPQCSTLGLKFLFLVFS